MNHHISRYIFPPTPPLLKYALSLRQIWKDGYLTNNGRQFNLFKSELQKFLDCKSLSICTNGTLAEECLLDLNREGSLESYFD